MSLLLNSLKKADSENQKAATENAPQQAAAPEAGRPAGAPAETIDFDSIVEETAPDGGKGEEQRSKELVSAGRVFRAGAEEDDFSGSGGGFRTAFYSVLGLGILLGGSYGLIASGLVPGVSTASLFGMFGQEERIAPVAQKDDVLTLAVAGSNEEVLPLPQPIIDIQADIDYAGLQAPDPALLETAVGRREYVEKIIILAGVGVEEESEFDDETTLDILNIAPVPEETEAAEEIEITAVKTAAASRVRKKLLDAQTPSDRILGAQVNLRDNGSESVVAQASAEKAPKTETTEQPAPKMADDKNVKVVPSLSGADRRRLLRDANRLYGNGAYAEAEAVYRGILLKRNTNIDALRGVALVAIATGRYQLAVATYLKILEYYPNDPVAIADLANLHGITRENSYVIEGALKKVIGRRPQWDSRLHFALGNLYAGNQRWVDAQQSYFKAYAEEQNNPDYAYNLAVVLDYLNKPELAVKYYREALALSGSSPSGFNASEVRARIDSILY